MQHEGGPYWICRLLVHLPLHAWLSHLKHAGHLYEHNGLYVQSMQQHCSAQPTVQSSNLKLSL